MKKIIYFIYFIFVSLCFVSKTFGLECIYYYETNEGKIGFYRFDFKEYKDGKTETEIEQFYNIEVLFDASHECKKSLFMYTIQPHAITVVYNKRVSEDIVRNKYDNVSMPIYYIDYKKLQKVEWNKVDWENVDYIYIDWNFVDWSKVDWSKIDWSKVDYSKIDYKKVEWALVDWSKIDYTKVEWALVDWSKVDYSKIDWSKINWSKINDLWIYSKLDWSKVDWDKVDYSKMDWSKVDWSKVDETKIDWTKVDESEVDWSEINWTSASKVYCGNVTDIPVKIPELTNYAINIIFVLVPVILVIMGTIDLFKGITSQKEDEIKKGQQLFVKRLIIAVLIFFIMLIVRLLVSVVADKTSTSNIVDCVDCFLNNDCNVQIGGKK